MLQAVTGSFPEVIQGHEASDLYRIIKGIDNKAFITVTNVTGVYGKGFDNIRV